MSGAPCATRWRDDRICFTGPSTHQTRHGRREHHPIKMTSPARLFGRSRSRAGSIAATRSPALRRLARRPEPRKSGAPRPAFGAPRASGRCRRRTCLARSGGQTAVGHRRRASITERGSGPRTSRGRGAPRWPRFAGAPTQTARCTPADESRSGSTASRTCSASTDFGVRVDCRFGPLGACWLGNEPSLRGLGVCDPPVTSTGACPSCLGNGGRLVGHAGLSWPPPASW